MARPAVDVARGNTSKSCVLKARESRNTRRLDENEISDNAPSDKGGKHTFPLTVKKSLKKKPLLRVKARGTPVTITGNSEAIVNVLDEEDFKTVKTEKKKKKQEKTEM